jgi:hypothetical protein
MVSALTILASLCPRTSAAEKRTHELFAVLIDTGSKEPVSSVTIVLASKEKGKDKCTLDPSLTGVSNARGEVHIPNVMPGEYVVFQSPSGTIHPQLNGMVVTWGGSASGYNFSFGAVVAKKGTMVITPQGNLGIANGYMVGTAVYGGGGDLGISTTKEGALLTVRAPGAGTVPVKVEINTEPPKPSAKLATAASVPPPAQPSTRAYPSVLQMHPEESQDVKLSSGTDLSIRWAPGAITGPVNNGHGMGVLCGAGKLDSLICGAHVTGDVIAEGNGVPVFSNVTNGTTTTEYFDGARKWKAGALVGIARGDIRVLNGTGRVDYYGSEAHVTGEVTADGRGNYLYKNVTNGTTTNEYWDGARRWQVGATLGASANGMSVLSGKGRLDVTESGAHVTADVTADGQGRFAYTNITTGTTTSRYWDGAKMWQPGAELGVTAKGVAVINGKFDREKSCTGAPTSAQVRPTGSANMADSTTQPPTSTGKGLSRLDTELAEAAAKGDTAAVDQLLQEGANIEAQEANIKALDVSGVHTVLAAAARNGHVEVVKLLLRKGANIEARPRDGGPTAFGIATERGHFEVMKLLMEKGAKFGDGCGYLITAVMGHNAGIVKLLLASVPASRSGIITRARRLVWRPDSATSFAVRQLTIRIVDPIATTTMGGRVVAVVPKLCSFC